MQREQSNQKDIRPSKEAVLTKNKAKKPNDSKSDGSSDIPQQIMGLLNNNCSQDLLICFKDKRTKQIKQFTTDPLFLSLDQIKISKKTENLQKFELNELVSRLRLFQVAQSFDEKKENEAKDTIKKSTESDHQDKIQKNVIINNIDDKQPDQKRIPLKNIGQNQGIDEPSKIKSAHFASDNPNSSQNMTNIQNLEDMDIQSAMSEHMARHVDEENPRHTSTLKKVVSVIEKENDIKVSQFLDQPEDTKQEHKFLSHSKKWHDDNICPLGIFNQQSRVDFAQKHLFRNGFKDPVNEEVDEDHYSDGSDSCFTAEDESLDEANLTDPTITNPEASLETNRIYHNSDESIEMQQVSGTYHNSYPANECDGPIQNIDMFMACCDWEAAIKMEKAEQESGQKIANDLHETQREQKSNLNNGNEDITNLHENKCTKRKIKMDQKARHFNDAIRSKNDMLSDHEQEIDIDSMMKRNPLNEVQRRSMKRVAHQKMKRKTPSKLPMIKSQINSQLQLNIEHLGAEGHFDHKRLKGSLSPLLQSKSRKSSQVFGQVPNLK